MIRWILFLSIVVSIVAVATRKRRKCRKRLKLLNAAISAPSKSSYDDVASNGMGLVIMQSLGSQDRLSQGKMEMMKDLCEEDSMLIDIDKGTGKHLGDIHELARVIPRDEFERVSRLAKEISRHRQALCRTLNMTTGVQTMETPFQYKAAWQSLYQNVKCPEGGGLSDQIHLDDLKPGKLQKVYRSIDKLFLGSLLRRKMQHQRTPELYFEVQEYSLGPPRQHTLMFFDSDQNMIHVIRPHWERIKTALSGTLPMEPVVVEGTFCTSLLQVLVHSIAHELVHALVCHFLPDIEEESEAYTIDGCHGPIFRLLNMAVFGHTDLTK